MTKYLIYRTSESGNLKPCDEAVEESLYPESPITIMRTCWTVEIDSLLDFISKYGSCIIDTSGHKNIPLSIEIYDTYRE